MKKSKFRKIWNKVGQAIINPNSRFSFAVRLGCKFKKMPDDEYVKKMYKSRMGKELDLSNPKTLNEKLQWLKLHDHKDIYTRLVDKYEMKQYVTEILGEGYVVKTYGVWDNFDDIDFTQLPEKFVIKCTHDSGGLIICKDKSKFDIKAARKKINKCMKNNFFYRHREWAYKNVKPRIIVEEYLVDESGVELKDYKIFCFNGHPEYIEVDFNRAVQHKLNPYDFDWNPLNFCDSSPNDYDANIRRPEKLNEMRDIAARLSSIAPFMRVDFYSIGNQILIGELTLYPGAGLIQYKPQSIDLKYGEMLDISGV